MTTLRKLLFSLPCHALSSRSWLATFSSKSYMHATPEMLTRGGCSCRYMFKYDSTHGVFKGDVVGSSEGLFINGKKIASYSKM